MPRKTSHPGKQGAVSGDEPPSLRQLRGKTFDQRRPCWSPRLPGARTRPPTLAPPAGGSRGPEAPVTARGAGQGALPTSTGCEQTVSTETTLVSSTAPSHPRPKSSRPFFSHSWGPLLGPPTPAGTPLALGSYSPSHCSIYNSISLNWLLIKTGKLSPARKKLPFFFFFFFGQWQLLFEIPPPPSSVSGLL